MTSSAGGDRIVVDPQDLRRTATRMRGAAVMLSGTGRDLAARPLPSMPAHVAALVTEVVCRVNASLQDLAVELTTEARTLAARAMWAELGGGDAIGWLVPGLHRIGPVATMPADPGSKLPPVTDDQIMEAERWAVEILDEMHDSLQLLDEEAARLGDKVDEVFGSELIRFADEYADEIPVKALGRLTLLAGFAFDAYRHRDEGTPEALARAGISAGGGAAGGALGVLACEAIFGVTGFGLVGCLIAGGIGGGLVGDQVGDEVFEE